jgi:hypothetical protein
LTVEDGAGGLHGLINLAVEEGFRFFQGILHPLNP